MAALDQVGELTVLRLMGDVPCSQNAPFNKTMHYHVPAREDNLGGDAVLVGHTHVLRFR